MIRGLINVSPKKRSLPEINKQNHERRKSEQSPRCISIFHRLFTLQIISSLKFHPLSLFCNGLDRDGKLARRMRGSTPHERWRRWIVRSVRSWRAAGVPEHSFVDRPPRRRSRSLNPRPTTSKIAT